MLLFIDDLSKVTDYETDLSDCHIIKTLKYLSENNLAIMINSKRINVLT